MKKLIIVIALASLFSCKKEATVEPNAKVAPATSTTVKKDSVFRCIVSTIALAYYEIDIKLFNADGKMQFSSKHIGSSTGKKDVFFNMNKMGVVTKGSYLTIETKYGLTTTYGKTGFSRAGISPIDLFKETPDNYIMTTALGADING